jgi:hypothetical protein
MRLDELFLKYGTDKGPTEHDYGPIYAHHFAFWTLGNPRLLELGVWQGASLQAWRDYFPVGTIVGVDRVDRGVKVPGVRMVFSEQDSPELPGYLRDEFGGFDIIIDDASHISSKTIATFRNLWPLLSPGGIYVIEDLQTSYDPKNYGSEEACEAPRCVTHSHNTAMGFCKSLADEVNRGLYDDRYRLGYDISRVTFGSNICFITKS